MVAQPNRTERDDAELRVALERGDPAGFAALYDRHADMLLRVAWGLLGDRAEAEDAVHDAFVGVVASRGSLARAQSLAAYLVGALRHAALRRRAARARRPAQLTRLPEAADDRAEPARDEALERALAALPADQREVLVLRHDAGMSFADAAALLGVGPNTAASRYRYALVKLRALLEVDR